MYKGKEYTMVELSRISGISRKVIWERIVRQGWSVEKTLSEPIGWSRELIKYNYKGKQYTLLELAQMCGIKKKTLYNRINKGWSVEEAVETSLRKYSVWKENFKNETR